MGVRTEKVVLSLQDDFTTPMARAAAATALLERNLHSLSGTTVETSRDSDKAQKSIRSLTDEVDRQSTVMTRADKSIDRYSGRLRLLTEAATVLGPGLVPLGAGSITAVAGLTSGLLAMGGALGTALLAFQGLGDAMDALDEFQLDPTTENLAALREEFEKIGPAGEHFVRYLDSIKPQLRELQNIARSGALPGFEEGIDSLLEKAPQVQAVLRNISREVGALASEGGAALAGDRFSEFFDYLETDAAPTLRAFALASGNVVEGIANLIVAFDPLSTSFSNGLVDLTGRFAEWSREVGQTQGFRDFVAYLQEAGPAALDFLGSLSTALIGIVQAAAPFGQTLLPILSQFLDIISAIASSPIGPPLFTAAAGFLALNRAASTLGPGLRTINEAILDLRTSPDRATAAMNRLGGAARVLGGAAGMGLLLTSLGETNDGLRRFEAVAGGALAGLSVGGPWGAAIGGAIGLVTTFGEVNRTSAEYVAALTASLNEQTGALTASSEAAAAKYLEDQGLLEIAEGLGLNLHTVTAAALGNKDALNEVNSELERFANVDTPAGVDKEMFKQREQGTKLSIALKNLANDTNSTVAAQRRVAAASRESGVAFEAQSLKLKAARGSARETAQGFISLGDSVDDAKVSLGSWIKELEDQARALEQFGRNAAQAARRGLDDGLIKSLKEAGPAGALRMKQLANATDAELGRANRAWRLGQKAIRDYVNITVPPKRITVDTGQALPALRNIQAEINRLKGKTVTVDIITRRSGLAHAADAMDARPKADGGTVPKTGLPYADRHPYLLADGEEVISNRHGQADKNRSALKAANAGAKLAVIGYGYADGGTAGDEPDDPKKPKRNLKPLTYTLANGNSIGQFTVSHSVKAAQAAMEDLRGTIRDLGSDVKASARGIKRETNERDRLSSIVEKNQAEFDRLTGLYNDLASTITTELTSDQFADVKGNGKNPWAAGATADHMPTPDEIIARMNADSLDALAFDRARETLTSKGLTGPALESILREGLDTAEMFAGLTPEKIAEFAGAFGWRTGLTNAAGAGGGKSVYGADLADANGVLVASQGELQEQTRALADITRQNAIAERQRDRAEKILDVVKDYLGDIRAAQKKHHAEAQKKRDEQAEKVAAGVNSAAATGAKRGAKR